MAIRLNGSAAIYRTANLLNLDANYAISFWLYVIARPGTENYSVLWQQDPGAGNSIDSYNILKIDASTAYFNINTLTGAGGFSESTASTNISLNTWYHIGIIRSANNSRIMYVNGTAHVTHTANLSGRTASTEMDMGVTIVNPGDYLDGRLAHIKIWSAALTATQIANEGYYAVPLVTTSLNQWHPTFSGATERLADYSGNGRNWTASGTLSDEDGPPVAWSPPIVIMPFPATGGGAISVTPAPAIAAASAVNPTVVLGAVTMTPAPAIAAGTAPDPTVQAGSAITITPAIAVATASAVAPTVILGAITITPAAASASASVTAPTVLAGVTRAGVLHQAGRYLANGAGPVFLSGFHTWYDFQDGGSSNPPPAFSWSTFVAALISKGTTFTKLWRLESTRHWPSDPNQYFGIQPWARTGPGTAADGEARFDLATFNQSYFDRLRARCIELGNGGVYVAIQLFNGFHIDNTKPGGSTGDPWSFHPFQAGNNINGIDGDTDNDGIGDEIRTTTYTAAYDYQVAYIEKVIDTVNDLDHVIYEIENEGGTYAENWQKALIDHIHTYEAGKPKQHPVGMTKLYPGGTNSDLTSSNAEWISPDEDLTPAAQNSTDQAWMYDTDHTVGDTTEYKWIFRALCQGYGGSWYMDPWDYTTAGDTINDPTYELIRDTLGYAAAYAARIDLANATPQGALSATGYALAKTTGLAKILTYQDASGAFTVNLTGITGTWAIEWFRTATGATSNGGTVAGGAVRTLTPPWSGEDVAAFLERTADTVTPSPATAIASAIAPTVLIGGITVTPDPATAAATAVAPTVVLGAISLTPAQATAAGEAIAPTVILGAVAVTPDPATAAATAVAPTVVLGAISLTPAQATAAGEAIAPTVILGAVAVTPDPATAAGAAPDPSVQVGGAISVTPAPAIATGAAIAPTVTAGSPVTVAPEAATATAAAVAPTVILGAVTVAPASAEAAGVAIAPTVEIGQGAIIPAPAIATAAAAAPTVILGAVTVTPSPATATGAAPNPTVVIGVILAAVTLTSRRNFTLTSRRSFTLTFRR